MKRVERPGIYEYDEAAGRGPAKWDRLTMTAACAM